LLGTLPQASKKSIADSKVREFARPPVIAFSFRAGCGWVGASVTPLVSGFRKEQHPSKKMHLDKKFLQNKYDIVVRDVKWKNSNRGEPREKERK